MDAQQRFWIRVLLTDKATTAAIKSTSSIRITDTRSATLLEQISHADHLLIASVQSGKICIAGNVLKNSQIIIAPEEPHIFNFNGDDYRGKLLIMLNQNAKTFKAINLVPLEPYLAGVVGAEMPDYWEPAALQAQAVAARTYCLYIKRRFGSSRPWDVKKTAANQIYRGLAAESVPVWKAVDKTRGQVLICRQENGVQDIFPAYYSSACGGHTENSKYVFGDSFEPLVGVACPYCKDVTKPAFFFWPMAEFEKQKVNERLFSRYPELKRLGNVKDIQPSKQSSYRNFSRILTVKLTGSTGASGFLRAEDLRLCIDPTGSKLRSTICRIVNMAGKWAFVSGRGYGHGVGLCQCGAQGLARRGKNYTQILSYYYPGSRIKKLY